MIKCTAKENLDWRNFANQERRQWGLRWLSEMGGLAETEKLTLPIFG